MNISVTSFRKNNLNLKLSDVITSVQAGVQDSGIVSVNIKTCDKYVDVDPVGSLVGAGKKGQCIEIKPLITASSGFLLADEDFGAYLAHPDYYCIQLLVNTGTLEHVTHVTPVKHEYVINLIPYEIAFNKKCLQDVTLEEC